MPHKIPLIAFIILSSLLSGCAVQAATASPAPNNAAAPRATLAPLALATRNLPPQATSSILLPEITLKKGNY